MYLVLSVLHEEKRQTGSDRGSGAQMQQKNVSDVTDIGAEEEIIISDEV